ncbi:DUF4304 domain-containing protein [Undibacterium macrobrachii]|jgi:hypothetical protein|uniref:DUF4304 domain-containing protein n=1 Tax=Undibacterium macrobrachii TaxID=1119058 RepID=UPI0016728467|nr:DUF4304 domain-containing protein [Undibacterium macrobrachii]
MNTFFNVQRKKTNDLMRSELTAQVVPYLRGKGFSGKLPCFRREFGAQQQLIEFQFNKFGRCFAVNLSICEPNKLFLTVSKDQLKSLRSQRLGSRAKRIRHSFNMDHWFTFLKGFVFYFPAYQAAANEVVKMYEAEADLIFSDLQKAIDTGVSCIHLKLKPPKNA